MNCTFGIRRYFRAGRTIVAGLLGSFLLLSVSGPVALLVLSCGTSNFAPASDSDSEENDASELDAIARAAEIWISGNDAPLIRVLVVIDEDSPPWPSTKFLRQGTRTSGRVLLDQVGLGYEA